MKQSEILCMSNTYYRLLFVLISLEKSLSLIICVHLFLCTQQFIFMRFEFHIHGCQIIYNHV